MVRVANYDFKTGLGFQNVALSFQIRVGCHGLT